MASFADARTGLGMPSALLVADWLVQAMDFHCPSRLCRAGAEASLGGWYAMVNVSSTSAAGSRVRAMLDSFSLTEVTLADVLPESMNVDAAGIPTDVSSKA